jgi:tRNA-dihydrouridine synthase
MKTYLAPMYDVTDVSFRHLIQEIYSPNYFYTEFTNVDALFSEGGKPKALKQLEVPEGNTNTIAQIWGKDIENHTKAAKFLSTKNFAGIDINMGCPEKSATKIGLGAGLIKDFDRAGLIIEATLKGSNIPVSVKTRTGYNKHITKEWISFLSQFKLEAIILHARTMKQMSKVQADWNQLKIAREIVPSHIKLIGNGDVLSYKQGQELYKKYNLDGIMIGRGIFQNLNIFNPNGNNLNHKKRVELLYKHIELWKQYEMYKFKPNSVLTRFFKIYIRDFEGAATIRNNLIQNFDINNLQKVKQLIDYK